MSTSIRIRYVKNGGMPVLFRRGDPRYTNLEDIMLAGRREVDEAKRWKPRSGVDY